MSRFHFGIITTQVYFDRATLCFLVLFFLRLLTLRKRPGALCIQRFAAFVIYTMQFLMSVHKFTEKNLFFCGHVVLSSFETERLHM